MNYRSRATRRLSQSNRSTQKGSRMKRSTWLKTVLLTSSRTPTQVSLKYFERKSLTFWNVYSWIHRTEAPSHAPAETFWTKIIQKTWNLLWHSLRPNKSWPYLQSEVNADQDCHGPCYPSLTLQVVTDRRLRNRLEYRKPRSEEPRDVKIQEKLPNHSLWR